jgi:hypothetical protein
MGEDRLCDLPLFFRYDERTDFDAMLLAAGSIISLKVKKNIGTGGLK